MVSSDRTDARLRWEDVIAAYTIGMFPMADPENGSIAWYAPDPRGIIDLANCVPTRSLRRTVKSGIFTVRWNTAFREVMEGCADREETWISDEIIASYSILHEKGIGHSVECWKGEILVGGLYGVSLGGAFFGESMFSRVQDASKVCLMALAERMRERGFLLLDIQYSTPHLAKFGGVEISREEYMVKLKAALRQQCTLDP
jgi:leucyl/phenylalanyl-tRNA--protein transferase